MTFSAGSFLKKWPEGVVTISALTKELMMIPSKIDAIFLIGIDNVIAFNKFKSTTSETVKKLKDCNTRDPTSQQKKIPHIYLRDLQSKISDEHLFLLRQALLWTLSLASLVVFKLLHTGF